MGRYQALTKMCLNNWHYINEKLLHFNDEINFFTGHSGSGKSTVLDALQIVLYADSNGRGFFNKAAKEDSDRSLLEYLRGMKVVKANNEISYLRNKNFSSTIVLEFKDTETHRYQCIGVIFDVDVSVNDINRMFFWHTGELAFNRYRDGERVLSINELKEYLKENYSKEEYYLSRTNEKFRNELYSNYFGGLHPKHFPALFKKAIPFKMDMKLEDFVKNYICTENDIHIEDMQDSVAQYTRLKRKLEDTKNEIHILTGIHEQYERYHNYLNQIHQYQYTIDKLEMKLIENKMEYFSLQQTAYQKDMAVLEKTILSLEAEIEELQKQRDEVTFYIQNSGYEHLEEELHSLNQMLEYLGSRKASYDRTAKRLQAWLQTDLIDDTIRMGIKHFTEYRIIPEEIEAIKSAIASIREKVDQQKSEVATAINQLREKLAIINQQISTLRSGQKAYPSYLLEVKDYLIRELEHQFEEPVQVDILADIIEVKNEAWLNAVEGYMGNNKLSLVVPPKYAKQAMEIYKRLDPKKYYKAAVIDTERVLKETKPILESSLAEEIATDVDYARAYVDYLMGGVIKCGSIDELRDTKSGITQDCILYQGYKIQHINPRNYREQSYIGQSAIERRLNQLQQEHLEIQEQLKPLYDQRKALEEILSYETLSDDTDAYEKQLQDLQEIGKKEAKKQECLAKIAELKEKNIEEWKAKKELLENAIKAKSKTKDSSNYDLRKKKDELERFKAELINLNEELTQRQQSFIQDEQRERAFQEFMREQETKGSWHDNSYATSRRMENLRNDLLNRKQVSEKRMDEEYEILLMKREAYRNVYAYRGFSLTAKDNKEYDQLLENLSSDKLNEYTQKANEQAKQAIYHFKTDFIYKIRDAIKEVMQQKDDLNRILAQLDFGKDKYKFIITRNHGEDGKFYDMFMDENLEINPHQLTGNMDHQLDMFSLQHEKDYSDLINELIELFMPPENCDSKTLEEARANMEKYADYRTYLSFDMEQIVEGMPPMRLSKMLSKNSGGEGQNPLYVALLASFAQVYRINMKANIRRNPTPRLVVLDEAFSKMDGEKVGSCIGLIRKLGFQAIISATNDKIQNYLDYVDKTFVFANPNKSRISIQEFEKQEFQEMFASQEDVEDEAD